MAGYKPSPPQVASKKPFYLGVTYCGNSTTQAEQLIDKVRNYTNLFVLQSGPLMQNLNATEQICDYAVNSGLNVIFYYTLNGVGSTLDDLLNIAQARWGSHFLGLYYEDESGGKMLDSLVNLYDTQTGDIIYKYTNGSVSIFRSNYNDSYPLTTQITFSPTGIITNFTTAIINVPSKITVWNSNVTVDVPVIQQSFTTTYYLNGTVTYASTSGAETNRELTYLPNGTVQNEKGEAVTGKGNISQFEPYRELWDSRPFQNYTDTANLFVSTERYALGLIGNQSALKLFTSDYALDWFDYRGGYDVVLAQLGWNQSTTQNIALVRGAADMQNKGWGAMITWASLSAPYLQSSSQMYSEMRQAYESGAEYVVVFNYSPNGNGTGLLQNEDFAAIQRFWTNVVQNPKDTNNVTAQDALVLPENYGWGMRNPNDTIWGLWKPDNDSQQVWNAVQASLARYGSKLDIVYDDPAYPAAGRYQHVYYWNQTI